jgi:hypothetical protein
VRCLSRAASNKCRCCLLYRAKLPFNDIGRAFHLFRMGHAGRYYNRLATASLDVLLGGVKAVPSTCEQSDLSPLGGMDESR